MISYQTYKLLNESSFTLGLGKKNGFGIIGSKLQEMGFSPIGADDSIDSQDQMGDFPPPEGEMGEEQPEETEEENVPCPACNPDGENEEGMEGCEACGGLGWLPSEEGQEGEEGMEGGEEMNGGEELTGTDDMSDPNQDPSLSPNSQPMMGQAKFMSKCKPCSSFMQKEEAVTDDGFFASLTNQLKVNHGRKNSGLSEEMLIAMGLADNNEPEPGQIGFAPKGAIGELGGGFKMDDFKELPTLGQ
jgi:hypothetical protein